MNTSTELILILVLFSLVILFMIAAGLYAFREGSKQKIPHPPAWLSHKAAGVKYRTHLETPPPPPPEREEEPGFFSAKGFLRSRGVHPELAFMEMIRVENMLNDYAAAKVAQALIEKALSEQPSSNNVIGDLEAENHQLKEEITKLREKLYFFNHNKCQQCSPEQTEAMKESLKMCLDISKELHLRMQDLEAKAKDV